MGRFNGLDNKFFELEAMYKDVCDEYRKACETNDLLQMNYWRGNMDALKEVISLLELDLPECEE